jgi:hypothetical protein
LADLIRDGTIHPNLTTKEAKALLAKYQPQPESRPMRPRVARRFSNLREFVETTLPQWSADDRALALSELRQLLNRISATPLPVEPNN